MGGEWGVGTPITYINDAIRHAITYTCGDYILLRRYKVSPTD